MADSRWKNGVWQGNRVNPMQAIMVEMNSPVQHGWHFDPATGRYELTHCGLVAWMRRATSADSTRLNLTGLPWLVGLIGDDEPRAAYNGLVGQFTPDVRQDLYRAALLAPVEVDDYGIEPRECGNSWGG
jgi:hypothetical protein